MDEGDSGMLEPVECPDEMIHEGDAHLADGLIPRETTRITGEFSGVGRLRDFQEYYPCLQRVGSLALAPVPSDFVLDPPLTVDYAITLSAGRVPTEVDGLIFSGEFDTPVTLELIGIPDETIVTIDFEVPRPVRFTVDDARGLRYVGGENWPTEFVDIFIFDPPLGTEFWPWLPRVRTVSENFSLRRPYGAIPETWDLEEVGGEFYLTSLAEPVEGLNFPRLHSVGGLFLAGLAADGSSPEVRFSPAGLDVEARLDFSRLSTERLSTPIRLGVDGAFHVDEVAEPSWFNVTFDGVLSEFEVEYSDGISSLAPYLETLDEVTERVVVRVNPNLHDCDVEVFVDAVAAPGAFVDVAPIPTCVP